MASVLLVSLWELQSLGLHWFARLHFFRVCRLQCWQQYVSVTEHGCERLQKFASILRQSVIVCCYVLPLPDAVFCFSQLKWRCNWHDIKCSFLLASCPEVLACVGLCCVWQLIAVRCSSTLAFSCLCHAARCYFARVLAVVEATVLL